jgi:phage shock protein C
MAVYCTQCGVAQPMGARFCAQCGAVIPVQQPIPGRPLQRPLVGRQVAGVCLALARANGWDVAVVRIFAVLGLCFSAGFVGIGYLAAWIGIPEETVISEQ